MRCCGRWRWRCHRSRPGQLDRDGFAGVARIGAARSSTDEMPVAPRREQSPQPRLPQLQPATLPSRMVVRWLRCRPTRAVHGRRTAPRSSISGELQSGIVSRPGPSPARGVSRPSLAQSRRRISAASLKIPALPPERLSVAPPHPQQPPCALGAQAPAVSTLLEPTADLSALPIADYASQSSCRLVVSAPHAAISKSETPSSLLPRSSLSPRSPRLSRKPCRA